MQKEIPLNFEPIISKSPKVVVERNSLTAQEKLLIADFKANYPTLDYQELADIFCVKLVLIENLFRNQFIIIESKMNKKI